MRTLDSILSQWARLGAMFNVTPADRTPDIEQLIVATTEFIPQFARLMPMAISWLARFENLVCRHRLASCAKAIHSDKQLATLGLLLSSVREITRSSHLNLAIKECKPLAQPKPLYDIDRQNAKTVALAA